MEKDIFYFQRLKSFTPMKIWAGRKFLDGVAIKVFSWDGKEIERFKWEVALILNPKGGMFFWGDVLR